MSRFSFDLREIGESIAAQLVVVLPIYNEAANIGEVISSWSATLRQLDVSFQIVALDDGSRDETLRILLQLEAKNPDLICVVSKPNAGHGRYLSNRLRHRGQIAGAVGSPDRFRRPM